MKDTLLEDESVVSLLNICMEEDQCSFGSIERDGVRILMNKLEELTVNLNKANQTISNLLAEIQKLKS